MNVLVVDVGGTNVKILAAMQALGSYQGGELLFLGLGTGLGSALVVDSVVVPMELAHLSYKNATFEDYVGARGLQRFDRKKWQHHVGYGVERLIAAFHPDDVVLGGGNAKRLQELPPGCRAVDNANALRGGFRLWKDAQSRLCADQAKAHRRSRRPLEKTKGA